MQNKTDNEYVKNLRSLKISNDSIIYYWWFKSVILPDLLKDLPCDSNKIKYKIIDDDEYALLYIGKAINAHNRLVNYHILDKNNFHEKGIVNRRLSSLRQTLCGLLSLPMSSAKELINEFMDQNCYVEWCFIISSKDLDNLETKCIRENYLPLNYQNTLGILSKEHRKKLKCLKKSVRK